MKLLSLTRQIKVKREPAEFNIAYRLTLQSWYFMVTQCVCMCINKNQYACPKDANLTNISKSVT